MKAKELDLMLEDIPSGITPAETLNILKGGEITSKHLVALKEMTSLSDEKIAACLNLSVKTYRSYKKPKSAVNADVRVKEHIVRMLALLKHGAEAFGDRASFDKWLEAPNFYFDHATPLSFLDTISGIQFVDDQLTGMEYGDNA
jgi:uncharacterized protein (DUF2384 family)